ncbi:MAG: hypothetical protein IJK71_11585 [Clostridia bacterium]|nr:hypothetical protein [Clostridia bacterium]
MKFAKPWLEILKLEATDIIATSCGVYFADSASAASSQCTGYAVQGNGNFTCNSFMGYGNGNKPKNKTVVTIDGGAGGKYEYQAQGNHWVPV